MGEWSTILTYINHHPSNPQQPYAQHQCHFILHLGAKIMGVPSSISGGLLSTETIQLWQVHDPSVWNSLLLELWPSLRGMIEEDILKGEVQSVLQTAQKFFRALGMDGVRCGGTERSDAERCWKMLKDAERCWQMRKSQCLIRFVSFDSDGGNYGCSNGTWIEPIATKPLGSNIQAFPRGMSRFKEKLILSSFILMKFNLLKPKRFFLVVSNNLVVNNSCQALEPLLEPFGFVWN